MNNTGAPHSTGDTYGVRMGGIPVIHSLPLSYNTTGIGSGVSTGLTFRASSVNPVQLEISLNVQTDFNGGANNIVSAGTNATANQWFATTSTTALVAGYYPTNNAVSKVRLTADATLYVKYTNTSTAPTTGQGTLLVKEFPENTATF